jgi:hypothetical protein
MVWGNRGGGNPAQNRGRPNLPPSQRTINISAAVLPATRDWLYALGGENLSRGIRKAAALAMQKIGPDPRAYSAKVARSAQESLAAAEAEIDAVYDSGEMLKKLDGPDTDEVLPDAPPAQDPPPGGWIDEVSEDTAS